MKRTLFGVASATVVVAASIFLLNGCRPSPDSGGEEAASSENVLWRSELFDYAMDTLLNRMDEFHRAETQQRTINRLDQWVRKQKPLEGWQPDPVIAGVAPRFREGGEEVLNLAERIKKLKEGDDAGSLETFPDDFRSAGQKLGEAGVRLSLTDAIQFASQLVSTGDRLEEILRQRSSTPEEAAEAMRSAFSQFSVEEFAQRGLQFLVFSRRIDPSVLEFPTIESRTFQEAVWLRNVASWASGEELDDPVKPAAALFDWVVKNVQLVREARPEDSDLPVRVLQTPVETLLFGKGTGIDRAWLFVLLARQMNMDAALLGLTGQDGSLEQLWGVGVLIEGEIYLFEPVLGLPVPRPGSLELTEAGFRCAPATLAEAASDEAILRQFDVVEEGSYAVDAKDMQGVVALVEASPSYLSQRMKMVQKRLSGDQKIVLTTDASAQIERFQACENVASAHMWPLPYQTLWQEIQLGPKRSEWLSKKLAPLVFPPQMPLLWKARNYHFKGQFTGQPSATTFYQAARRSDYEMGNAGLEDKAVEMWREIKIDASYWLGLVVAHTENYRAAEDYFKTRVLMADPGGEWEHGATYNLARVNEATGEIETAVQLYQIHLNSPQAQGNLIRARWLMQLAGMEPKLEPKPAGAEKEATESGKEKETETAAPSEAQPTAKEKKAPKPKEATKTETEAEAEEKEEKMEPKPGEAETDSAPPEPAKETEGKKAEAEEDSGKGPSEEESSKTNSAPPADNPSDEESEKPKTEGAEGSKQDAAQPDAEGQETSAEEDGKATGAVE